MTRFDRDIACKRLDGNVFERDVERDWWGDRGPHGGYLAAVIQRAMRETVDDDSRPARNLAVHFIAPATEGTLRITTAVERKGRSLTAVSARVEQDGSTIITAHGSFSSGRDGAGFNDLRPPDAPRPDQVPRIMAAPPLIPPFLDLIDYRFSVGPMPYSSADRALSGAWMRWGEPRLLDPELAAFLMDAAVPAVFARLDAPAGVPTVEMTIHYARALPLEDARPDAYSLGVFRAESASEGFMIEDGELWSEDGVLLARSRQLALLIPRRPDGAG